MYDRDETQQPISHRFDADVPVPWTRQVNAELGPNVRIEQGNSTQTTIDVIHAAVAQAHSSRSMRSVSFRFSDSRVVLLNDQRANQLKIRSKFYRRSGGEALLYRLL
jgi:hypothetical protein